MTKKKAPTAGNTSRLRALQFSPPLNGKWGENLGIFFFDPLEGVGVAKGFNRKARSFYLFITQTRTQRCVSFVQANKTKGTGRWDRMTRTNRPVGSSAPNNTLVHPPTQKKNYFSCQCRVMKSKFNRALWTFELNNSSEFIKKIVYII